MRKRLAIVGHSEEGLGLIPLLEANPDVDVCAILTDDADRARHILTRVDPALVEPYAGRLTADLQGVLQTPGLVALIDADASGELREALEYAPERGIQVTTPLIAKLLYAFGPVDATRKPDLLQTLGEILESYNLTVDRRGLLSRILQIAVGATGADRGSLMLYVPAEGALAVEVAIGIERELISKIRVRPGEGIAGRAFEDRSAILLHGKADRERYRVVREREDVESAISAPLVHDDHALGVLNLSHGRRRGAFSAEDLRFVEQLAALDAKIIARAEEYHTLQRDSAQLRAQSEVRRALASGDPLARRLSAICRFVARELEGGICHLFLRDAELDLMVLRASSARLDPLGSPLRIEAGQGIHGWVAATRAPVSLSQEIEGRRACFAVVPLVARGELLGLLSLEGMSDGDPSDLLRDKVEAAADALASELDDALREARMEREATKLAAIAEASTMMSASKESAELHRRITTSAAMILEAEHAVLRLQDPATGRYQIRSYFGSAETDAQGPLFAFEKELSIRAIQRRAVLRVTDAEEREELATHGAGVSSALAYPLQRGSRVIGTLSLLGKVAHDPLATECFARGDEAIVARLCEQAAHALESLQERETARHHRRFDDLTALPNSLHLRERLEEEIARSSGRGRQVLLVRLQVKGLAELLQRQRDAEVDRLVLSIAQELRSELREFDVLARSADDTFEILVPEPEADSSTLLGPLARRARNAIARDTEPGLADRLGLELGYARFPDEGATARALLDRAAEPRIVTE